MNIPTPIIPVSSYTSDNFISDLHLSFVNNNLVPILLLEFTHKPPGVNRPHLHLHKTGLPRGTYRIRLPFECLQKFFNLALNAIVMIIRQRKDK